MGRRGQGGRSYYSRQPAAAASANTTITNECCEPTAGLEDMVFTIGKTKDFARFEVIKEELGKYFATQSWSDAADAARTFEVLVEPVYTEPTELDLSKRILTAVKVTNTSADGVVTKTIAPGEVDTEYDSKAHRYCMPISRYSCEHDKWKSSVRHLEENKSRIFVILLQYYPKDLMQRLKSNNRYYDVNDTKDVILLVTMIRDVAHAHDDTTQGTIAIVASNVALYTTFMSSSDDTDDFYRTFLAMVETINVHGGSARYHPQLYDDHFNALCKEINI